jgi:aminopeptidase
VEPDVLVSISKDRMGLDRQGLKHGYEGKRRYDSLFDMLIYEGRSRAFWSPGATPDTFARAVPIDYARLRSDCRRVAEAIMTADSISVTAPGGTDISVGIEGRSPKADDGDIRVAGRSGNLPAGEVYVSPALGATNGTIAFDGSIALDDGDVVVKEPIVASVKNGFVRSVRDTPEGRMLKRSMARGQRSAVRLAQKGELKQSEAEKYRANARAIGELGIGLNRNARIVANMLEDEKVYGTCHFAVGSNYDGDADALIHLDGLVKSPTIVLHGAHPGDERTIMAEGKLVWD